MYLDSHGLASRPVYLADKFCLYGQILLPITSSDSTLAT